MEQEVVYTVIRRTLKKELPELVECPRRGIRRLLDLGVSYFAESDTERRFFRWMQDKLRDPQNPYYKYMEHIACNVSHELLATFITDLGYNSLSYGANRIRSTERNKGFHVPWLLMFDAGNECPKWLMSMWSIVDQGKSLGIYSYLVRIGSNKTVLRSLLNLIEHERECAFFFHVSTDTLDENIMERIVASQNVFLLLDMDSISPETNEVVRGLREHKCLYGGIVSLSVDEQETYLKSEHAADAGIHTLFFAEYEEDNYPHVKTMDDMFNAKMYDRNKEPVLALDFIKLALYIDSSITGHSCLGVIDKEGYFGNIRPGARIEGTELNILNDELNAILEQTMSLGIPV